MEPRYPHRGDCHTCAYRPACQRLEPQGELLMCEQSDEEAGIDWWSEPFDNWLDMTHQPLRYTLDYIWIKDKTVQQR
jgi:hypothetical protein